MTITPLTVDRIPDLEKLPALGEPYIRLRDSSDYWLYATLFADLAHSPSSTDRSPGA